ncbi:MAG: ATP-binding protein, partial [Candidatus Nanohaloarchaea archaeon]
MNRDTRSLLDLAKQSDVLTDESVRKLVLAAELSDNELLQDSAGKAVLGKSVKNWQYPFEPYTGFRDDVELGETF